MCDYMSICACICVCMCAFMYECICACDHVCICMCECAHVCMCVRMCACVYVCFIAHIVVVCDYYTTAHDEHRFRIMLVCHNYETSSVLTLGQ